MAITPSTLTPTLISNLQGVAVSGATKPQFANAVATAFVQFLATIPVATTHVGVLGAGTGQGKVTIAPSPGVGIVSGNLSAQGISGSASIQIAQGVVTGLAQEMNANAVVQVVIAGSSTGTGQGSLVGVDGNAFTQLLLTAFAANGIGGSMSSQLALGLGQGVAQWLKSAVVTTVDVGTPSPPFGTSAGSGTGKVF